MTELSIEFGIAARDGVCPEVPPEIAARLGFLEHRVHVPEDVANFAGTQRWCFAHALDPTEGGWREVIEAIAAVPTVRAVNAHVRPEDEYALCHDCGRRFRNLADPAQRCHHCLAPVGDWQVRPGLDAGDEAAVCEALRWAAHRLAASGKRLLLENTYEPPELMERIFSKLPDDVGFTLDVGHSLVYHGGPNDYVHRLAPRLCHLHLHDNMGGNSERHHDNHLPPGCGRVNWLALARALRAVGFRGTATFECMPSPDWLASWLVQLGVDREARS